MYFSGKEYVKSSGKYQAMLADMKERTEEKLSSWQEDSRLLSGWGHAYFCNEDGGRLLYDPKQPFAHKCSICGKVYRAFLYNSCHVTITRNLTFVEAENSGSALSADRRDAVCGIYQKGCGILCRAL